jgi:hypothetical protein
MSGIFIGPRIKENRELLSKISSLGVGRKCRTEKLLSYTETLNSLLTTAKRPHD